MKEHKPVLAGDVAFSSVLSMLNFSASASLSVCPENTVHFGIKVVLFCEKL